MHAILHVELVEQTQDNLHLRFWRDNLNDVKTRSLARAEINDLINAVETDYYNPLPARLSEIGRRLFRWLDGGERFLAKEIAASANQIQVLVLAISIPHGLAHLPWEALHDGTTFLLHAANPPVLPVRWQNANTTPRAAQNRPLQALFMASSPGNVEPVLDYEAEEAAILAAVAHRPLDLTVEESGSVKELGELLKDYGQNFFDVLHLTGHADHIDKGVPVFVLEDSVGRRADVTAPQLAQALPHRPPLVFLSGCRTGQSPAHREVRSLAEQLIAGGFRAVLGWGRKIRDTEATLAAGYLYQDLAAGESLPLAMVRTYAQLRDAGAFDWHLLRLFCAGDPPAELVTPVKTRGRKRPANRPAESEFLDPLTRSVKVATRASFVGRRRLLQNSLRQLRDPQPQHVGLLLHGQGGRGKSSVAARLCDRLRRDFQRVVVIGRLDETSFTNAWAPELPDDAARQALRDSKTKLRFRIEAMLKALADAGLSAPLFVLDDFEQNQPAGADGDLQLHPDAAGVLLSLFDGIKHAGSGRVLITCRYALPEPFAHDLHEADVPPLDANEQEKQSLRLDQKAVRQTKDVNLLASAKAAADGNPRLFEWLHRVLEKPGLDHAGIIAEMQAQEEKFREHILARRLVASLAEESRVLLGRMLLLNLPVPFEAVQALDEPRPEAAVQAALDHADDLGLVDVTEEDGKPHYRVPHQLGGGSPPPLSLPDPADGAALTAIVFDVLYRVWRTNTDGAAESRMLELIRLAHAGGKVQELCALAEAVTDHWLNGHRYAETAAMLSLPLLDFAGRPCMLLMNLARAEQTLGRGPEAGQLLKEAVANATAAPDRDRAAVLFHYTQWLGGRGELDEVLRISRDDLRPLLQKLGADRECAVVSGQIADVLAARGELDEAMRIRREEELPVYERLGDVRSRAVTLGKIADVLAARGELDEALRIRRDEQLPVYERLGDVRSRAVTLGKIADVLAARGELDEALRIRRDEQLPVYERLGDVRSRAVTLGKIADVLAARGELDEALRIRREEQLPVFERLGDVRSRAVTLGKIADVLAARGELDEALRISREEELPVYERLGDVQSLLVGRTNVALLLLKRARDEDTGEAKEHLLWSYVQAARRNYKEAGQIAAIMQRLGMEIPPLK